MSKADRKSGKTSHDLAALENMHTLLLEALRHREQEITRYLAILGPTLGGFVWILNSATGNNAAYVVGCIGVVLLLALGALYSLALGYNYRYLTLELAKLEWVLHITDVMLEGWPKTPKAFIERYRIFSTIPWCAPPEVIKVFWWAFLIGIGGVTVTGCLFKPEPLILALLIPLGLVSILLGGLYPIHLGKKLLLQCSKESGDWLSS